MICLMTKKGELIQCTPHWGNVYQQARDYLNNRTLPRADIARELWLSRADYQSFLHVFYGRVIDYDGVTVCEPRETKRKQAEVDAEMAELNSHIHAVTLGAIEQALADRSKADFECLTDLVGIALSIAVVGVRQPETAASAPNAAVATVAKRLGIPYEQLAAAVDPFQLGLHLDFVRPAEIDGKVFEQAQVAVARLLGGASS
jgi:hypothetical protein